MATVAELQAAGTLPKQLNPQWFDGPDVQVPGYMLADPTNWQNNPRFQAESTHVRFVNGEVHPTCYPAHVGRWVLEEHAVICARPDTWEPELPRVNTFDLEAQATRFPSKKGEVR